ncbi:LuxR C-terminal-related transcriptional regulator [Rhodococcus jostii]
MSSPALVEAAHPLPLTSREREVGSMVAAGLSNRQIAVSPAMSMGPV